MIVIRRSIDKVRSARRLEVFHVPVDGRSDVRHAVDQRAGGDLGWLLGETVADLNEPGGRRLGGTHRLVARLIVHIRRSVSGIM